MSSYSALSRIAHSLFLGNDFLAKNMFDFESLLFRGRAKTGSFKSIFILGLPRSGTTYLLNKLHNPPRLASLTYGSLPLLFAPVASKLFGTLWSSEEMIERAHGDGIMINSRAPECIDQVLFERGFTTLEYEKFVRLFLGVNDADGYLSKNYHHIYRVPQLRSLDIESRFVFIFRDPLENSLSLLQQHLSFCASQNADPFILKFMNLLGHREFGINAEPFFSPARYRDKGHLNYWLEQWLLYHQFFIENIYREDIFLIDYKQLGSEASMVALGRFTGSYNGDVEDYAPRTRPGKQGIDFDMQLYKSCKSIYRDLKKISQRLLQNPDLHSN